MLKPTYSSLKRGRILPRDPKTNHTVSEIAPAKIFSPCNPKQAKKVLERKLYLDNTTDINIDIPETQPLPHNDEINLNKTALARFIPTTRSPNDIICSTNVINSANGFATFLHKEDEIPRLSVLENYKQISRIMRNSFLKAKDIEQRFKNNALSNEELKRKREEEENNKKLTKILKQMNSPRNAFVTGGYTVNNVM